MALFKPLHGARESLGAQPLRDGYAYFCTNDGSIHIDFMNSEGILERKQMSAQYAEQLLGYEVVTSISEMSSQSQIPTSKSVWESLINVVSKSLDDHNSSTSSHTDIRMSITDLTKKLNQFLDVDDDTVDQLSEVLYLIDNNRGALESITSMKINVNDIANNLETDDPSKVLSAAQGVVISGMIDAVVSALDSKLSTFGGTLSGGLTLNNSEILQSKQPYLSWGAFGANQNRPYIGFAQDQSDGTFIVCSLGGVEYRTGLAIDGGSGNLLWKGSKVITINDPATSSTAGAMSASDKNRLNSLTDAYINSLIDTKIAQIPNASGVSF